MTDNIPTPQKLLASYRVTLDGFNREMTDMFNAMSQRDRDELLFHMLLHQSAAITEILAGAAATALVSMPGKGTVQ